MKILEAMALGSPIVSTTVGAEGLGLEHGRELLLADTPGELAGAAVRLLNDPVLRDQLARQARRTALERFSWDAVARKLETVHASVMSPVSPV